eukprot:scaffold20727_cov160-Skeletonema_marinoi.AAC.5
MPIKRAPLMPFAELRTIPTRTKGDTVQKRVNIVNKYENTGKLLEIPFIFTLYEKGCEGMPIEWAPEVWYTLASLSAVPKEDTPAVRYLLKAAITQGHSLQTVTSAVRYKRETA